MAEKDGPKRRHLEQLTFEEVVTTGERQFYEDAGSASSAGLFDPDDFSDVFNTDELVRLNQIAAMTAEFANESSNNPAAVVEIVKQSAAAKLGLPKDNVFFDALSSDDEVMALYTNSQNLRLQEIRNLIADALDPNDQYDREKDRRILDQSALYLYDPTKYTQLARSSEYKPFRIANRMLSRNFKSMLSRILPHNLAEKAKLKRVKLVDVGLGDGRKGHNGITQILNNTDLEVDYHGVDISPLMNFIAHYGIVKKIVSECITLSRQPEKEWASDPFADLIRFIIKHELKLSNDELIIFRIFNIFHKFTQNYDHHPAKPSEYKPDLLKHMIARFLSLHKKGGNESEIKKLDDDVKLRLRLLPVNIDFMDIDQNAFHPQKDETTLYLDLGSRCNNAPFKETLDFINSQMEFPTVYAHARRKKSYRLLESDIKAKRYLIGHQILNFNPETVDEDSPVIAEMMQHFNNKLANLFAIHPFNNKQIYSVVDAETNEKLDKLNIYYPALDVNGEELSDEELAEEGFFARLVITFEEDKRDAPGYYGSVHRLRFIKPVTIRIKTSQRFTPHKNVTKIREYQEKPGSEVVIIPSYNPELMQRLKELANKGLHVIDFFVNRQNKPDHVKILVRAMLSHEREGYRKKGKTKAMMKLTNMKTTSPSGSWSTTATVASDHKIKKQKLA